MPSKIIVTEPAKSWLHNLRHSDRDTLLQITAAINVLQHEGPAPGRPLVDRITGSSISNLKELRSGSSGASEVRGLFVFDPPAQCGGPRRRRQSRQLVGVVPNGDQGSGRRLRGVPELPGMRSHEREQPEGGRLRQLG
ncbi:type II toxin-antitoxin system RelE/ParE family toxin [Streptomyces sp. NPDC050421]|uniref:type II toxin-antitoxin system RelE/ParE family toxin n=1 Tax=unclassified Streptomyces TaxID=2593676 RepID=UPI0037893579